MRQDGTREDCITCRLNRGEQRGGPGGFIYRDDLWVLEHAMEPIPMVGWLVMKPFRHVESFADLKPEEAASFGPLTHRITRAMNEILHPTKAYLGLFAEARDYQHLHMHIIPRFADLPADRRGPHVFEYLVDAGTSEESQGDLEQAVSVSAQIREALAGMVVDDGGHP